LVAAIHSGRFIEVAGVLSESLWQNVLRPEDTNGLPLLLEPAPPSVAATHLDESDALRQRLGHYLGATFFYGGEWYWGIDRLHHLDARLSDLGIQRPGVPAPLFPAIPDLKEPVKLSRAPAIDFFFSLRSPYSAIVAQRVFELGRLTGATVNLRYVLPMVMRGLPVPADKRKYISRDAAREAFVRGVPFGRLSDPVGRPTERGLALMPYAIQMGQGQSYVLSFMRGVLAEGIDAGTDRG
jgi:2-hydroxychromene-2-carboxylate isomerase